MPDALPNSIDTYLRDVVVRARRREVKIAILWAATVFGTWGLGACAADRYLHLTAEQRITVLAGGIGVALVVLLWPLRRWARAIDWVAVATVVESYRSEFEQRLVTITSRLIGPREHRGSDAMVAQLLAEVERQIADDPDPVMVSATRRLIWPIVACAAVVLAAMGMFRVPGMELPRLAARFAMPWRQAPYVTTTRLVVLPDRDSELSGTDPAQLRIDVSAERLGDGIVSIYTQPGDERAPWSRLTMDQLSPGRFEYVFAGIDSDTRYYIAGGDAVSRVYSIRMLRRPAVADFSIQYRYPDYVRRSEATVSNTDGRIEAPAGTAARLTITATEPLQSATLRIGSQSVAMDATSDPARFTATIPVTIDQPYALAMLSNRRVSGSGPASPGAMQIHALPNRPPMLRLTDANGEPGAMLSVDPRQVLPVAFEAEDDFGITELLLRWQLNDGRGVHGGRRGESAVGIPDGVRHIEDTVDFDLASLPLHVGDVLTIWLEVHNTAGQKTVSEPIEALMAAEPVDSDMRQRLAAIDAAVGFVDRLAGHLNDANGHAGDPSLDATSAALSSATEDAGLLRQTLLRAIAHGAARPSAIALAGWVDSATLQSYWSDRLFQQVGDQSALDGTARGKLNELTNTAHVMHDQLLAVDQGQWAEAALAELANLKNANDISGMPARIRHDESDDAKAAGVDNAADESTLKCKVASATALIASQAPIDFVPPAQQWTQEISADPQSHPSLSSRLRSAAEAEALQQEGDLLAARDLELSSRAGEGLEAMAKAHPPAGSPQIAADLQSYLSAITALQQEWRFDAGVKPGDTEPPAMLQAAAEAREQMNRWAHTTDALKSRNASALAAGGAPRAKARSAESAALDASARSASRHATATTRPGLLTVAMSPGLPAQMHSDVTVGKQLAAAQQIDAIDQRQEELIQKTSVAAPAEAPTLARQQQQVADSIATVAAAHEPEAIIQGDSSTGGANAREREATVLLAIEQQLAEMPQQLASVQDALSDAIAAARQSDAAKAELARVSGLPKNVAANSIQGARRAAAQSSADSDDASRRLVNYVEPVSAAAGRRMSEHLAEFAPETATAESALSDQLLPALVDFERSIQARDSGGADRSAGAARNAIGAALQALSDAQNAVADRDPLVTAGSSARAAVQSLQRSPPDFSTAVRHQTQVTLSLSRAWDQSIHGAAAQRLAAVPGLASIFQSTVGPVVTGSGNGVAPLAQQVAHGRQWGRLQGQGTNASAATPGENADPPGYEDALRLYFQALGQAQKDSK